VGLTRVCIVGAKGMLGRELVRLGGARAAPAAIEVVPLDVEEIDIADAGRTGAVIGQLRPEVIINAAAYTDVDGCERQGELAAAVNADGPGHLARACAVYGGRLVHVSTDFVFDGRQNVPYGPADAVRPLSAYGRTKADGERQVREALEDHVIVRTSWLFGVHGKNFVKTILRLSREKPELRVVDDQVGCPTHAPDLADALLRTAGRPLRGTYHFCNRGVCYWYDFAREIVRQAGSACRVVPIKTGELDRPAVRPAYSVLRTDELERDLGIVIRPWPEALADCLGDLEASAAGVQSA